MPMALAAGRAMGGNRNINPKFNPTNPSFRVQIYSDNFTWGASPMQFRVQSSSPVVIDWGDGSQSTIAANSTSNNQTHVYAKAGNYILSFVSGWQGMIQFRIISSSADGYGRFPVQLLRSTVTSFLFGGTCFTNRLEEFDWNGATALTVMNAFTGLWNGSLNNCAFRNTLTQISVSSNPNLEANLDTMTWPSSLNNLSLGLCERMTGNIVTLLSRIPNIVTSLFLTSAAGYAFGTPSKASIFYRNAQISGNPAQANWLAKTVLTNCMLVDLPLLSGDISAMALPNTVNNFQFYMSDWMPRNTNITGSIQGWSWPTAAINILIGNFEVTGDLSAVDLPNTVNYVYLWGLKTTKMPRLHFVPNIRGVRYFDNGLTEAEQKAILQDIFSNWASFTFTGFPSPNKPTLEFRRVTTPLGAQLYPQVNLNANLAGVYADEDPPVTSKGLAYELNNNPEATANRMWVVNYENEP